MDVKESFFKGERMSEERTLEVVEKMKAEDATFNIVGQKSIDIALKSGLITEEGIKTIQGIPFALVLLWVKNLVFIYTKD